MKLKYYPPYNNTQFLAEPNINTINIFNRFLKACKLKILKQTKKKKVEKRARNKSYS